MLMLGKKIKSQANKQINLKIKPSKQNILGRLDQKKKTSILKIFAKIFIFKLNYEYL